MLLTILLIVLGLFATLMIIALLLPGKYHVEKNAIIKKSVVTVMNNVADLNQYSKWNPWQQSDPGAKGTITGEPNTIGHRYAWQGKKVGEGQLTIREIDNHHVHFNLEFFKPFKSKASDDWQFEEWGEGETKVTWSNNGPLPLPIARLMGPMIVKGLNKQFEEGLDNLRKLCEGA